MTEQEKYQHEELKERMRHQDMVQDIRSVLATKQGRNFIKYLFESFDVGELPPMGLEGSFLMERLGFLRAGNSIFKIVAESSPEIAGQVLAEVEKEKYDKTYQHFNG